MQEKDTYFVDNMSKNDCQMKILNLLIEISDMYIPYSNLEKRWNSDLQDIKAYYAIRRLNFVKAAVFSFLSSLFVNNLILNYDPDFLVQLAIIAPASVAGGLYFDYFNNFSLDIDSINEIDADFCHLNDQLEIKLTLLFKDLSFYVKEFDFENNWNQIVFDIFDQNELYIDNMKRNGKINNAFDKDFVDFVLAYYLEDIDVFDKFIDKQRCLLKKNMGKANVKSRKLR